MTKQISIFFDIYSYKFDINQDYNEETKRNRGY